MEEHKGTQPCIFQTSGPIACLSIPGKIPFPFDPSEGGCPPAHLTSFLFTHLAYIVAIRKQPGGFEVDQIQTPLVRESFPSFMSAAAATDATTNGETVSR